MSESPNEVEALENHDDTPEQLASVETTRELKNNTHRHSKSTPQSESKSKPSRPRREKRSPDRLNASAATTESSFSKVKTNDFSCPHCEKRFTSRLGYVYHMDKKVCQESKKPFVCPQCNKHFTNRKGYNYHVKRQVCSNEPHDNLANHPTDTVQEAKSSLLLDVEANGVTMNVTGSDNKSTFYASHSLHQGLQQMENGGDSEQQTKQEECNIEAVDVVTDGIPNHMANDHRLPLPLPTRNVFNGVATNRCDKLPGTQPRRLEQELEKKRGKRKRKPDESDLKCSFCEKSFISRLGLTYHVEKGVCQARENRDKLRKITKESKIEKSETLKDSSAINNATVALSGNEFGQRCVTLTKPDVGKKESSDMVDDVDTGGKPSSHNKKRPRDDSTSKICTFCSREFTTPDGLTYHVQNYVCRPTERPGGLLTKGRPKATQVQGKKHYKLIRGSLADRTCQNCDKVFTSIFGLQYHTGTNTLNAFVEWSMN
jgi:hypothetical protein